GWIPAVIIDRRWIGGPRGAAVISPDAFPRDQLLDAVTVQVSKCDAMSLRPGFVDHVLFPLGGTIGQRLLCLPPIEAEIMTAAEDDIQTSVLVQILHREGTTGMGQGRFLVQLPWSRE